MSNYKWKMKSYWAPTLNLRSNRLPLARSAASEPFLHSLEIQINHRRQIQGHDLRNAEPANDGQSQSAPRLRAGAPTQGDRQGSHQRRHRRHHDWPESDQARLKDRFLCGLTFFALCGQRNVDDHDGVFLDDSDQHDQTDESVNIQLAAKDQQRQQRAQASRWQAGKNCERMNKPYVKNSQYQINNQHRYQ